MKPHRFAFKVRWWNKETMISEILIQIMFPHGVDHRKQFIIILVKHAFGNFTVTPHRISAISRFQPYLFTSLVYWMFPCFREYTNEMKKFWCRKTTTCGGEWGNLYNFSICNVEVALLHKPFFLLCIAYERIIRSLPRRWCMLCYFSMT